MHAIIQVGPRKNWRNLEVEVKEPDQAWYVKGKNMSLSPKDRPYEV